MKEKRMKDCERNNKKKFFLWFTIRVTKDYNQL